MKLIKKYWLLGVLIILALVSVGLDIILKSDCTLFNDINKLLLSMLTVIAGFWVTCYLLFIQIYKDRYSLKFVKNTYLPQMKSIMSYIMYSIIFGCLIIIKNKGVFENGLYVVSSIFILFLVLRFIYNTSKTMMVNTYINDSCEDIKNKINICEINENKTYLNDIKSVLDECVVREEYIIVQNISNRLGEVFCEFIQNSIKLISKDNDRVNTQESFETIVNLEIYQLEQCKNIKSNNVIEDITDRHICNIAFCIQSDQYEWYKKYINLLLELTTKSQKENNDIVVSQIFQIYTSVLQKLIKENKFEWIKYIISELYNITTSLNYLTGNINLKYFASLITYGLLNCEDSEIYDYLYSVFKRFTNIACWINKGFSDIKVYYVLYFADIIEKDNLKNIQAFFDMVFESGHDSGSDTAWTEFKFFCIKEVLDKKYNEKDLDIRTYHIDLLVEVIEMKEKYRGVLLLPSYKDILISKQYESDNCEKIYDELKYLLGKCIVNDNISLFCTVLKCLKDCIINTESRNKDIQIRLFKIYIYLINRTKRLINKQFIETIFNELEEIIKSLDSKKAISYDFGKNIIDELAVVAKNSDSDNNNVVLEVLDIYNMFLEKDNELNFVCTKKEQKEQLYKQLYDISTTCIENDFEEGLRKCSNIMGWFTIYSINQGSKLTQYLDCSQ